MAVVVVLMFWDGDRRGWVGGCVGGWGGVGWMEWVWECVILEGVCAPVVPSDGVCGVVCVVCVVWCVWCGVCGVVCVVWCVWCGVCGVCVVCVWWSTCSQGWAVWLSVCVSGRAQGQQGEPFTQTLLYGHRPVSLFLRQP